ncbi:MAG TPA: hypothetical protein VK327_04240 [Candidatus Paceibacterota bacterium]|nr:hypothetical protein [Candidatus Paceibacterota bacterium]
MSLVNDALRRAKQHTTQPIPAANLQLRPIEPAAENTAHGTGKFPLVFTVMGIVLVALVITGFLQAKSSNSIPVQAATAPVRQVKPAAPIASVKAPAIAAPAPSPVVEVKTIVSPPSNATTIAEAPAPKALPPKLQAIFFNNNRPSAMIDGRTVYVGNRIRDYRVAAITPNSAMLVSGATTNILSFQE